MRWTAWITLGAALIVGAGEARAQSAETERRVARDLGNEGIARYESGDYPGAVDRLTRAYAVIRAPTLGLWLARSQIRTGQLVEASEHLEEVIRMEVGPGDPPVFRESIDQAREEHAALQPRIPAVELAFTAPPDGDVAVTMDGRPVRSELVGLPLPVNPGEHTVEARAGDGSARASFSIAEGERKTLELALVRARSPDEATLPEDIPVTAVGPGEKPPAEADTSPRVTRRAVGLAMLGGGGAVLVASGVTGVIALRKQGELEDLGCVERSCPPSAAGERQTYNTLVGVAYGTLGFGVLVGAAGGYLLLGPTREHGSARRIEPWVGVGEVGVKGVF